MRVRTSAKAAKAAARPTYATARGRGADSDVCVWLGGEELRASSGEGLCRVGRAAQRASKRRLRPAWRAVCYRAGTRSTGRQGARQLQSTADVLACRSNRRSKVGSTRQSAFRLQHTAYSARHCPPRGPAVFSSSLQLGIRSNGACGPVLWPTAAHLAPTAAQPCLWLGREAGQAVGSALRRSGRVPPCWRRQARSLRAWEHLWVLGGCKIKVKRGFQGRL